jgi:hypothetical protein
MSNIASLADFRTKRGLPPAVIPVVCDPLERVLRHYRKYDMCITRKVLPKNAMHLLATASASAIVRWAEQQGRTVDSAARFQFFADGELLQVRVNRIGPPGGPWQPQVFQMGCAALEVLPLDRLPRSKGEFKPLLTLPMSEFYRLR